MTSHNSKPYTLILRDAERALPLKDLLVSNNINVIIEPIYTIAPIKFKPIAFEEYQALLITSVNTIKILAKNACKEEIRKIKTYCVGKITEKYALEAGFNCVKTNAKSGETLANEVIKKVKDNNKKILIVGAKNLAYDPIPKFKHANISVKRIVVYKKIPNQKLSYICSKLLANEQVINIVIYSPETAIIFLGLMKNYETKKINIVCLGIKTKKVLETYNWKKVQVIDNIALINFANNIIKSNMI
jgi:uroporphyrinogen-III synthase